MVKTPIFKIEANGKDITSSISKNLVSISFKDEANEKADQLTLKVTGAVSRPAYEDTLKLYLGYDDKLTYCGSFTIQSTTRENNYSLTINATGANFNNSLKEKKDITYEKLSISKIVSQIAKRNNLKFKSDMDDIHFESLVQQNESDMHFLNRKAKELNAIFNIKNDTIVFRRKIKDNEKSNNLPSYTIDVNNCESITIKHSNRILYKSCKISWHDTKEGKTMQVVEGEGEPQFVFKNYFKNAAEAKESAKAKLQITNQTLATGSLSKAGEILFAGGILTIKNSIEDDGEYQIKSVSHTFDNSGWKTSVEFEN